MILLHFFVFDRTLNLSCRDPLINYRGSFSSRRSTLNLHLTPLRPHALFIARQGSSGWFIIQLKQKEKKRKRKNIHKPTEGAKTRLFQTGTCPFLLEITAWSPRRPPRFDATARRLWFGVLNSRSRLTSLSASSATPPAMPPPLPFLNRSLGQRGREERKLGVQ